MIYQWHHVSETLPDSDIVVLAALDDGEVWPAYLDEKWLYVTGDPIRPSRVLYWCHMPEHPDAKKSA